MLKLISDLDILKGQYAYYINITFLNKITLKIPINLGSIDQVSDQV